MDNPDYNPAHMRTGQLTLYLKKLMCRMDNGFAYQTWIEKYKNI